MADPLKWSDGSGFAYTDGKHFFSSKTPGAAVQLGYQPATAEQIAAREAELARREKFGTPGQVAQGAAEKLARTATFGLVQGLDPNEPAEETLQRAQELDRSHGLLSFSAELGGGLASAAALAATGGLFGAGAAGAGAAGLGSKALGVARNAAIFGSQAEAEASYIAERDFDPAMAFAMGVGGELLGGAMGYTARQAGKFAKKFGSNLDQKLALTGAKATPVAPEAAAAGDSAAVHAAEQGIPTVPENVPAPVSDLPGVSPVAEAAEAAAEAAPVPPVETTLEPRLPEPAPAQASIEPTPAPEPVDPFHDLPDKLHMARERALHMEPDAALALSGDKLERDIALNRNADAIYDSRATRITSDLDAISDVTDLLMAGDLKAKRIAPLVSPPSAAQRDWWGDVVEDADELLQVVEPFRLEKETRGAVEQLERHLNRKMTRGIGATPFHLEANRELNGGFELFNKADSVKRILQRLVERVNNDSGKALDRSIPLRFGEVVDRFQSTILEGLQDEALFGKAAKLQREANSAMHNLIFPSRRVVNQDLKRIVEARTYKGGIKSVFDPDSLRGYLRKDDIGGSLTTENLTKYLDGAEQLLKANQKFEAHSPAELKAALERIQRVRASLKEAGDVTAARHHVSGLEADARVISETKRRAEREARASELAQRAAQQEQERAARAVELAQKEQAREQAKAAKAAQMAERRETARVARETREAQRKQLKAESAEKREQLKAERETRRAERVAQRDKGRAERAGERAARQEERAKTRAAREQERQYAKEVELESQRNTAFLAAAGGILGGPAGAALGFAAGLGQRAASSKSAMFLVSQALGQRMRGAARALVVGGDAVQKLANKTPWNAASTFAMSRFTNGHSGPMESLQAKREWLLPANDVDFAESVGHSFGVLPITHPQTFAKIGARFWEARAYLREHMPPSIAISLSNPSGIPPSREDMQQIADLWTAVAHPDDVLTQVAQGGGTLAQVEAIREVHPEFFLRFATYVLEELSYGIVRPSESTAIWIEAVLGIDGAAGPSYSTAAAELISVFNAQQLEVTNATGLPPVRPKTPSATAAIRSGPSTAAA
jgi:hypothetical protein